MPEPTDVPDWKCLIFDRSNDEDAKALDALRDSGRVRRVHDEIDAQREDLARSRQRRSDADPKRDPVANVAVSRWVYYPWLESLVHVLAHADFRELRLDRNRHKITSREQDCLASATVAIVGLSAGNAIARTLCLEGVSERFKLADFDVLALSNMNRLEAGVQDLGLRKTVLLARQLSEINPYVDVMLWHDGITPDNLDEFLLQAPRPSVLVDECDNISMKLLLRERARSLGLPVLMETSDRGMMDVERFDLEPNRPILHGLVKDVSSHTIRDLRDDDRLAVVLAIVGAESISTRAAASLLEMNQTISTWPQLASDVVLGGAVTTVAVRRLVLGQPLASGRYYIDVDSVLAAEPAVGLAGSEERADCSTVDPSSATPMPADAPIDSRLTPFVRFVAEHGCLAPSGGNCQPWRFYFDDGHLWVVHDRHRSKNLLDSDARGSYLALGAAIENVVIAAAHRGSSVAIEWFPRPADRTVVARLSFSPDGQESTHDNARRFPALRRRVTNRQRGAPIPLDEQSGRALSDAAASLGVQVQLLVERDALAEMGRIVGQCDRLRFLSPRLHKEMMGEVRWTDAEAERSRNGLALDTLGLTGAQTAVLRLLARSDVVTVLHELDAGQGLTRLSLDTLTSSSAIGLIASRDQTACGVLTAGRAFERLWLDATAMTISLQPLGAITAMLGMLRSEAAAVFAAAAQSQLRELETAFYRTFSDIDPQTGLMLFRLSNAPPPVARALRLPLRDVLFAGPPRENDRDH